MNVLTLIPMVHKLAGIFESLHIKYAFGGALANNYWGTIRATQDIDILVLIPALRYQQVATALTEAGFSMLIGENNTCAVNVRSMVAMVNKRHLFAIWCGGFKAEDLIIFKMIFHREKDLRDIKGILWSQREKIDLAYIRRWASKVLESEHLRELENCIKEYTQNHDPIA